MALKYADIPVVAAPFGMTLGGGCEIALHGARVRASAETYMGLVEAGVGLVPGGGGTKEMALRAHDRVRGVRGRRSLPVPEAGVRAHRVRQGCRRRAQRRSGCS